MTALDIRLKYKANTGLYPSFYVEDEYSFEYEEEGKEEPYYWRYKRGFTGNYLFPDYAKWLGADSWDNKLKYKADTGEKYETEGIYTRDYILWLEEMMIKDDESKKFKN